MTRASHSAAGTLLIGGTLFAASCLLDILAAGAPESRWTALIASAAFADDDDDDDDDDGPRVYRRMPRFHFAPAPRVSRARRAPPVAAIRHEWVAAGVTAADVERLRGAGFTIVAERQLALLPERTVRLRAPRRLSDQRAQAQLRALIPAALLDRNHLYRGSARPCRAESCFPYQGPAMPVARTCAARGVVGMIDTGVNTDHAALRSLAIETEAVHGPAHRPARGSHGTDVAILIAAGAATDFRLVAVDAFHRRGGGDTADSFDIVAGLDRLAAKGVTVANLSLAGPTNGVLARAGAEAARRGMTIVAAAGNDGPSSPPRYPAAYDWAIAVTAVDPRDNVYARAVQGPHIAFAAPGVRVQLPDDAAQPGPLRSGTSYASALVTAALSARRAADPKAANLTALLAGEAQDLGAPGRDPVFGWGRIVPGRACLTN